MTSASLSCTFLGSGWGGGEAYHVNLGGGNRTVERSLQNHFLEASEVGIGLVGASFLREMTESRQKREGKRIVGVGVQNNFGEGFYGMSPPPEFSTPLCRSLSVFLHVAMSNPWT